MLLRVASVVFAEGCRLRADAAIGLLDAPSLLPDASVIFAKGLQAVAMQVIARMLAHR